MLEGEAILWFIHTLQSQANQINDAKSFLSLANDCSALEILAPTPKLWEKDKNGRWNSTDIFVGSLALSELCILYLMPVLIQ